jgi:hypothetical protein
MPLFTFRACVRTKKSTFWIASAFILFDRGPICRLRNEVTASIRIRQRMADHQCRASADRSDHRKNLRSRSQSVDPPADRDQYHSRCESCEADTLGAAPRHRNAMIPPLLSTPANKQPFAKHLIYPVHIVNSSDQRGIKS